MVKVDKPIRENYPDMWEVFDYMELGFWCLAVITILMLISILFKWLESMGADNHRDILHPGLRLPPGHAAHQAFLLVLNLLRAGAVIIVGLDFMERFSIDTFFEANYWDFFVLGLLPTVFNAAVFILASEWLKMQWMGGPERWEEYIEAYETGSYLEEEY